MLKGVSKFIAKSTWPYRRALSRASQRKRVIADISLLKPLRVEDALILKAKRLLVCQVPSESPLLAGFLEHHRRIGVDHFLFVTDNYSSNTAKILLEQSDCSLWESSASHGTRITNALIQRYCLAKWVLCLEFGEYFAYPYMETRSLADLTSQLDDLEKTTMWGLRIDLYGAGPLLREDADELRYFDATGYYQTYGTLGQLQIKGGAVSRILNVNEFGGLPYLHRLPLLKPLPHVFYKHDRRHVMDEKLNWPHKWHPCPTCVLLARDFNSGFCQSLVSGSGSASVSQHVDSFSGSLRAKLMSDTDFSLKSACSVPYESSASLIDSGLMSDGGALRPTSRFGTREI